MSSLVVRNLPDETHRALKARAARHGRSTEAEIRDILETAVRPQERVKIGSRLAAFGRRLAGLNFDPVRDKEPTEPARFD
jgi:plasmid stability protein